MEQLHLPIESLGSLDTLVQRLQAEVAKVEDCCVLVCICRGLGAAKLSRAKCFDVQGRTFDLATAPAVVYPFDS